MKSIYNYKDYRKFLKDWIKNQPKNGRGILKKWSELLRVEPSVVSQILGGSRNFSVDQSFDIQSYLGLTDLDAEYFDLLIQLERAAGHKLKNNLFNKLEKLQKESQDLSKRLKNDGLLSEDQKAIFYSNWIYSAVRLSTSIGSHQTLDSIVDRLNLGRQKISGILKFLMNSGLIVEEMGKYKIGPQRTHLDKSSPFIFKHHTNWRLRAIQRSETLKDSEVMFSGPLTIAKKDFETVREEIIQLISRISTLVKETEAEELAVFNVDLFWMVEPKN